jgi:hypothetical protein
MAPNAQRTQLNHGWHIQLLNILHKQQPSAQKTIASHLTPKLK